MKREIARKLIHLATAGVAVLAWVLPRPQMIVLLCVGVALAVAIELGRSRSRWLRHHFLRRTRTMLRPHERDRPAGATYMAIAYLVAVAVFPKPVAVVAMLYNGLGDATAALVGRRWGTHRVSWGKSWEGFAAGLAVNLGVGILVPGVPLAAAVVGAAAASALEFLPVPIDDNLRVTIGGGLALWLGWILVGPPHGA